LEKCERLTLRSLMRNSAERHVEVTVDRAKRIFLRALETLNAPSALSITALSISGYRMAVKAHRAIEVGFAMTKKRRTYKPRLLGDQVVTPADPGAHP
jgi:hypothetical protein